MLAGLLFWLSPARRRFMRRLGRAALRKFEARARATAPAGAAKFLSVLLRANAEFLAYALSREGPFASYADRATTRQVEACMASMLIYATALFARAEMVRDDCGLVPLLAAVTDFDRKQVMLRRDQLRKTPRSEEWMLYTWLVKDLGGERPVYDRGLEQAFGYQYLSYIGQYRPAVARALADNAPQPESRRGES